MNTVRPATCTCQGDIVIGGLSVGISGSEVGRVVTAMRGQLERLLAERRPEAREYLDDPRAGAERAHAQALPDQVGPLGAVEHRQGRYRVRRGGIAR